MIKNKDRRGWIGASDTVMVMGSWNNPSWKRWWAVKIGLAATSTFASTAMLAGTWYEHPILDALGIKKKDRQIRIRRLRLRVNLDGEDKTTVHEVKTYGKDTFKVSRAYWMQAQVEMFATGKKLVLHAYHMTDAEYENFFLPIDKDRLSEYPIEYDRRWIEEEYLPRLRLLAACLREGVYPDADSW